MADKRKKNTYSFFQFNYSSLFEESSQILDNLHIASDIHDSIDTEHNPPLLKNIKPFLSLEQVCNQSVGVENKHIDVNIYTHFVLHRRNIINNEDISFKLKLGKIKYKNFQADITDNELIYDQKNQRIFKSSIEWISYLEQNQEHY